MSKPDLLVVGPLPPHAMDQLEAEFTCHHLPKAADREALIRAMAQVRAAVTNVGVGCGGDLMRRLPALRLVASLGVGYETVDVATARACGVAVTNTPDVLTDDVADLAIGLLLAAVRRIPQGDAYVRAGKWLQGPMALTGKVGGRRLGILGMGRIGQAIARRAEAFNLAIAYSGPRRKAALPYTYYPTAAELAAAVDFLVLALPGGAETRNAVDATVLDALGPQGILVNIARGSVVDEPALIAALRDKRLGGAALDVFVDEPRVPAELLAFENVVVQPHVGSATVDTRRAMAQLVVDNVRAFFAGRPLLTPVP